MFVLGSYPVREQTDVSTICRSVVNLCKICHIYICLSVSDSIVQDSDYRCEYVVEVGMISTKNCMYRQPTGHNFSVKAPS